MPNSSAVNDAALFLNQHLREPRNKFENLKLPNDAATRAERIRLTAPSPI